MLKITKFGGSSVANAEQFKKIKAIIQQDPTRRYIVVSAPGKRFAADNKITDLLYLLDAHRKYHVDASSVFKLIKNRFIEIKNELGLKQPIEKELDAFYTNLNQMSQAVIVSRGEYFCAKLMAEYLGYAFVDAKDIIRFKLDKSIDWDATSAKLQAKYAQYDHFVFPGFYGTSANGHIQVFPRGGGDITGAILAKCLHADVYENWTDVSGFLMADPTIVKNPKGITHITYSELRELSYMGASVLHEEAIFPVKEANIPIHILNTNRPQDAGTIIQEHSKVKSGYPITGIAGKKGMSVINIEKDKMNSEVGFGRNVLRALEKSNVSFEHMPSGVDTMSVVIQTDKLAGKETTILDEIRSRVHPDQLYIESNLALIAVVGRGMKSARGTAAILFTALADARVNIKMIDQGSSELNIIIGVAEEDFAVAMKAIYNAFIKVKK